MTVTKAFKAPHVFNDDEKAQGQQVGTLVMRVTRNEYQPVYAAKDGRTYGDLVDEFIKEFYSTEHNDIIDQISVELSEDAQRALRELVRGGNY